MSAGHFSPLVRQEAGLVFAIMDDLTLHYLHGTFWSLLDQASNWSFVLIGPDIYG